MAYQVIGTPVNYEPVSYPSVPEPSAPPLPPYDPAHDHARAEERILSKADVNVTEQEARRLLERHVSKQFLWSMKPIKQARMLYVEDCSGYQAVLESFIESRSINPETFAQGYHPDGGDQVIQWAPKPGAGRQAPSPWDFDIGHLAPPVFESKKVSIPLLYTKRDSRCKTCKGAGQSKCTESGCEGIGRPKACFACRGSGFLLDQDGKPTAAHCIQCQGTGKIPCSKCQSFGVVTCPKCQGTGHLSTMDVLNVEWSTKRVQKEVDLHPTSTARPARLLQTEGHLMFREEALDCQPVLFPDLDPAVARLSAQVIAARPHLDGRSRKIFERHTVSLVPVTGYFMTHDDKKFQAYIYGLEKKICVENYPAQFAPLERCVIS